jgi:hypothetical protein
LRTGRRRHAHDLDISGTVGERRQPGIRRVQRRGESVASDRQLDARLWRRHPPHRPGCVLHFRNRRDAGDRFRRECADGIRHGTNQFPVDVHGAAAHAGGHAGLRQRATFEPGEDQIALRTLDVVENAENVCLEFLEVGAFEHGTADTDHARFDFVDRHERRRRRQRSPVEDGQKKRRGGSSDFHGCQEYGTG